MCKWSDKNGLGLVEVVISMAVITVGLLGLLMAFGRGAGFGKTVQDQSPAWEFAQAKIEELAGLTYENVPAGTIEDRVRMSASTADYFYNFTRSALVELVSQNLAPSGSDVGLKKITVSVYFPAGYAATEQEVKLVYLKSKR